MSCCRKETEEQKVQRQKNQEINKNLVKDRKKSKIKLLLLGAGESGKSTIAKQMRIIHLNGYESPEERLRFKPTVYSNILENVRALLEAAEKFGFPLKEENQEAASKVFALDDDQFRSLDSKGLGAQLTEDIKRLWADPAIQKAFARSAEFQLTDSAEYFFTEIDRIAKDDYVPVKQDILRVRAKTTGINEIEFKIGNYHFGMTDVGGQRSERRKWIHCFEDVTAIIFCAALSEYDQKLYEDETTNRMYEALRLFSDITNSKWFNNTPIILFLNKKDLFEKKIQKVPLKVCFDNYDGPNEYEPARAFIEKQFLAQIQNPQKLFYVYTTCATDTQNVKFIFRAVKDVFITVYLTQMGLLGSSSTDIMGGGGGGTMRSGTVSRLPPAQPNDKDKDKDKDDNNNDRKGSISKDPK